MRGRCATGPGSLLIAAARRAGARQDVSATVDLLDRIMEVLPSDSAERRLAMAQLGWAIFLAGDAARSEELLERTREEALAAGDPRAAAWAAIGLIYLRNSLKAAGGAEILAEAEELRDTFRALGDREGADQAELVAAMSLFFLGRAAEAAARAHAVVAAPDVTPLNFVDGLRWEGAASVFGPLPTSAGIALIRGRQQDQHVPGSDLGLARMLTLQGRYDEARESAQHGRSIPRAAWRSDAAQPARGGPGHDRACRRRHRRCHRATSRLIRRQGGDG